MFPVLPLKTSPDLDELILQVTAASAALGRGVHPLIREAISKLMLKVNSYYTNAMEGNPSRLGDIDAALVKNFSPESTMRHYQLEHLAHIQVQQDMMHRLMAEPTLSICSQQFLSWLHEQFFMHLPPEMRFAITESGQRIPVVPGQIRDRGITVGRHSGPKTKAEIENYLAKFEECLSPERLLPTQRLLGMASSHHRFLWVHPFPEGNGRVARLLTTAYACRIGIGDDLLWTVSRAFARKRSDYDLHLALADQTHRNDLDGRGPLSEENLLTFCLFFLRSCLDQISYMSQNLKLHDLTLRYHRFLQGLAAEKQLSKAGVSVMKRIIVQGEMPRAQIKEVAHVQVRRATQITKELLDAQLVSSPSAYGPLRLNISAEMAAVLFPALV